MHKALSLTSLVTVVPAPTVTFLPILTGATSWVSEPIKAPSSIIVLCLIFPAQRQSTPKAVQDLDAIIVGMDTSRRAVTDLLEIRLILIWQDDLGRLGAVGPAPA